MLVLLLVVGVLVYRHRWGTPDLVEGLNTFNGRMAINDMYFYDRLFSDVYYYANSEDGNTTGWSKCKSECPGHCVEYMVSGNSYCFPY